MLFFTFIKVNKKMFFFNGGFPKVNHRLNIGKFKVTLLCMKSEAVIINCFIEYGTTKTPRDPVTLY